MGIWVYLLLSVVSANSACITLSLNETAVINPREYLDRAVSSVEIKSTGEHKAAILEPGSPTALFRIETGRNDWNFGPSVLLKNVQFFTVLYRDRLEVWKANGDSIDRVWGVNATVNRVVPLQLSEAVGFVYWTQPDFQLFLLNLNSPMLSANPIAGVETQDISLIAACSNTNLLLTVQSSPQSSVFTYYEINYNSLIAVKTAIQVNEGMSETLLDALCSDFFYLLSPTALLSWNHRSFLSRIPLPSSLGPSRSLHYAEVPSTWCIHTSRGVIIGLTNTYQILPGVLRVHWHRETLICIEHTGSRLVVTTRAVSCPSQTPIARTVLSHQELQRMDDLLCLRSPDDQSLYLLVKSESNISGLIVRLSHPSLVVSSYSRPYTFDLCSVDTEEPATCVSVTVITLPYKPGKIVLDTCSEEQSSNSTIALKYTMISRRLNKVILLSKVVSGWNMKAELTFPDLPPYLSCSVVHSLENSRQVEIAQGQVDNGRFLCAKLVKMNTKVLLLRNGNVEEDQKPNSIFLFSTSLSIRASVAREEFYALYAEDAEQGYLLVWRDSALEQYPLQAQGFISLRATDFHALVLMQHSVHITTIAGMQWQRIEGQYVDLWVGHGRLVLRTTDSLEFYELQGDLYVYRGRCAVSASITQFALTSHELLALTTSNTLSVYHITGASALVLKFAVEVDCPVSHLAASENVAICRCPSRIQVLLTDSTARSLLHKAIAAEPSPLVVELEGSDLFEVHEKDGVWRFMHADLLVSRLRIEEVMVRVAEWYDVPGSIALQGLLIVSNEDDIRNFSVNITIENHGAVITSNRKPTEELGAVAGSLEPWESAIRLKAFDYFQGRLMHISAESNSDLLRVEISGGVEVQHYLMFPRSYKEVTVVPEIQTLFAIDEFALIACKYQCEGQRCEISSKVSVPLVEIDLLITTELETLITFERFAYIRLLGQQIRSYGEIEDIDLTICYDSKNLHFTVISRHTQDRHSRNLYIVPGNLPDTFHLLYYSIVLEHCTAHAEAPMNCTEVADPSLVLIESVGSVKVSERCWRVYAVTSTLQIVALELCEELTLYSVSSLVVSGFEDAINLVVAGEKLLITTASHYLVYSLPEVVLVSQEPLWTFGSIANNLQLWRVGTKLPVRFLTQLQIAGTTLLDLSAPPHSVITARLPFSAFQFTGENCGVAIANNTAVLMSFSATEIVLMRVDTALETTTEEVTITAQNDMSTVPLKVSVVLVGRSQTLQVTAVGTVGVLCALLILYKVKREQLGRRLEVEMIGLGNRA